MRRPSSPTAQHPDDGAIRCGVLIVGAGHAGLSTAYHLHAAGRLDYLVIEAEDGPGGWARTDWTGAWGADRAIHVLHFKYPETRALARELLGAEVATHDRIAIIDSRGVRTSYPFHAHLHGREPAVVQDCLEGLREAEALRANGAPPPRTFAEWIALQQGRGVARHFMDPYNTKLWTVPPEEMWCDWMGDYIPAPDRLRDQSGAQQKTAAKEGRNATFDYPLHGASGLPEAMAARIHPVRYNTRLSALDPDRRLATLSDGALVRYETLVSTMPLKTLIGMLEVLPDEQYQAWERLESVDLMLVDIGFKLRGEPIAHWVYFPDPDVLAYRMHQAHALSPSNVPEGCGLYVLEISHSRHRPLPEGDLRERTVGDLVRTGWLGSSEQVVFYRERPRTCSYVVPRPGWSDDARLLREYARGWDIHSIGRFGEWKYCSQEDALRDGRTMADKLIGIGAPAR
jgi:protoporphyrinogen oxidase